MLMTGSKCNVHFIAQSLDKGLAFPTSAFIQHYGGSAPMEFSETIIAKKPQ